MEKRKVIIDCDPGIDDVLALMLAIKSEELEILGITVCSGNVPAKMGAKNAIKVLEICEKTDIPVYIGEELPLVRELVTAQDTHGEDGLGENNYSDVEGVEPKEGGVQFIIDTLKNEENVSIIALAPLTNIAKALQVDKEAFANIDEFVTMGGNFKSNGNCSPVAEFNYWVDPHAADYVYKNMPVKVQMIGLDVTREIVLTPNRLELMSRLGNEKMYKFIKEITRFYIDFHWNQEGIIGCVINDPLAIAYFIDKSICSGKEYFVEVEEAGKAIGMTIVDEFDFYKREKNALVLTEVDSEKTMKMFMNRIFPGNKELIEAMGGNL